MEPIHLNGQRDAQSTEQGPTINLRDGVTCIYNQIRGFLIRSS